MTPMHFFRPLALAVAMTVSFAANAAVEASAASQPTMRVGDDTLVLPKALSALEQNAMYALVYGYPKVYFDTIYQIFTNIEAPSTDPNFLFAPVNQFSHATRQQTRENTNGMAPNSDTLYSSAFFDVSKEPVVWHVPAWAGNFYVCPLHNTVADNISIGTRTNGAQATDYLITGPHWVGEVPVGMQRVQVDSDRLWTVCRIRQDFDKASIASANQFQQGMRITPLSAWGKAYTPPAGKVDTSLLPAMTQNMSELIAQRGVQDFLTRLSAMLSIQPPTPEDNEAVAMLKMFGVVQGQPFNWDALSADKQKALEDIWPTLRPTLRKSLANKDHDWVMVNGWPWSVRTGRYAQHYLNRATSAELGFSGNMKEDNMQSVNSRDSKGQPLQGDKHYVIHFAPGQTPPVEGFWSYTTYDKSTWDIALPEGRNPVGNHDKTNPLHYNADGSVDIYVQSQAPSDPQHLSNWLPTPAGKEFIVYMRMYGPHPSTYILNSANQQPDWTPPALQPVSGSQSIANK